MKFHYTLTRIAKIKKTENIKYQQGCGVTGILIHCWWQCKVLETLLVKVNISYETKHTPIILPSFNPTNLSMINKNIYTTKDLYNKVHYSYIHNTPKLETTQVSINKRMYILWCIHPLLEYCSVIKIDKPSFLSSTVCGSQQSQAL